MEDYENDRGAPGEVLESYSSLNYKAGGENTCWAFENKKPKISYA